jgi:hypothetical protein
MRKETTDVVEYSIKLCAWQLLSAHIVIWPDTARAIMTTLMLLAASCGISNAYQRAEWRCICTFQLHACSSGMSALLLLSLLLLQPGMSAMLWNAGPPAAPFDEGLDAAWLTAFTVPAVDSSAASSSTGICRCQRAAMILRTVKDVLSMPPNSGTMRTAGCDRVSLLCQLSTALQSTLTQARLFSRAETTGRTVRQHVIKINLAVLAS